MLQIHYVFECNSVTENIPSFCELTLVCDEGEVGWFGGVSLETLPLDDREPVVEVLKTGVVSDVVHKHDNLQQEKELVFLICISR